MHENGYIPLCYKSVYRVCASLSFTMVLIPFEKGKSWRRAGTIFKNSTAEQNTGEPAANKKWAQNDIANAILVEYLQ